MTWWTRCKRCGAKLAVLERAEEVKAQFPWASEHKCLGAPNSESCAGANDR